MNLISVRNLAYSYGDKLILDNINFEVLEGEIFGIIGPNGSGKTTLLSAISGFFNNYNGEINYRGKSVSKFKKKELAKSFAYLEQEGTPPLFFTVEEVVAMGRYPWSNNLFSLSYKDNEIIETVLKTLDLFSLRKQPIYKLSGGERQLVSLARALVQDPTVLFLDEPTNYLDIGHQVMVMNHIKKWQEDNKLTVIMVLHDLNIAAQYCDRLLLLNDGKIEVIGPVDSVITEGNIASVYKTETILINHPINSKPQVLLRSN